MLRKYRGALQLEAAWTGSSLGGGIIEVVGGQMIQFTLESECKCGKKYKIEGFASFLSAGWGIKVFP